MDYKLAIVLYDRDCIGSRRVGTTIRRALQYHDDKGLDVYDVVDHILHVQ